MGIPLAIAGGAALFGAVNSGRQQGRSNELSQQAIDLALADYNSRQPLREGFTKGALSPIAQAPDLSGVFADPSNPFSTGGVLPQVGSQLDFSNIDLGRTAQPRSGPSNELLAGEVEQNVAPVGGTARPRPQGPDLGFNEGESGADVDQFGNDILIPGGPTIPGLGGESERPPVGEGGGDIRVAPPPVALPQIQPPQIQPPAPPVPGLPGTLPPPPVPIPGRRRPPEADLERLRGFSEDGGLF